MMEKSYFLHDLSNVSHDFNYRIENHVEFIIHTQN